MEIFKPQRAPLELESSSDKRIVNTNGYAQIIPVENGRTTIDIVQQALGSTQIIPVSGLSGIPINAANQTRANNSQKKAGIFVFCSCSAYAYFSMDY